MTRAPTRLAVTISVLGPYSGEPVDVDVFLRDGGTDGDPVRAILIDRPIPAAPLFWLRRVREDMQMRPTIVAEAAGAYELDLLSRCAAGTNS